MTLHNPTNGPDRPDFSSVRSIAVVRALQLGDLLCIVPALRALRAAAPNAHITLIGLPWAASFAQRFGKYIDDYLEFPGFPGLPECVPQLDAIPGFIAAARQRRFDLALQFHGSGILSNPLTVLLGAHDNAGFHLTGQYCPHPQRFLLWDAHEHEVLRYLRLMEFLGVAAQGTHMEFPLSASDDRALRRCSGRLPPPGTYACIHPGSRLASRRWLPQRFADIGDRLAGCGLHVVLSGTADEAGITRSVRQRMRAPALDLAGKTGLGSLAALMANARLMVCNDTGVSHIAAAVATPSVVICCGADPRRWAPLDRTRHRVLYHPVACRPCMHAGCPIAGHPCAAEVTVQAVWAEASELLSVHAPDRRGADAFAPGGKAVTPGMASTAV
jgi:ADP-heptose:LPS heptosyltransferase